MKHFGFALLLLASVSATAFAQGAYPIYGIHFFSDSVSQGSLQVQNGKPMWTVEMYYTQDSRNWDDARWQQERNKFQNMRNKNFRIILRVDYAWWHTIPPQDNWTERYYFAMDCKQIALKVGDLIEAMIIGNELLDGSPVTSGWYATVFNASDDNCVYKQVKSVRPGLKVGIYAPGGWPGSANLSFWDNVVASVRKDASGKPEIDCFPLHAYSGASTIYNQAAEDPRYGDECDFRGFVPYMRRIYSIFGTSKPVYITETNTQWYFGQYAEDERSSDRSYRDNWLKEALQAVSEWNEGNDLKISAFCWFVWQYQCIEGCDQFQNSLCRTDNDRLNRARSDFGWVTWNKNLIAGNPGGPIRIQAENYTNSDTRYGRGMTNGISGTDYYDTTSGNTANFYRYEDVDISVDPYYLTVFVGWTAAGEWLRYESLFGGGNYRVRFRFSRGTSGTSRVRLLVDGVTKWTVDLDDPDDNWDTYHLSPVSSSTYIPPGDHYLTLVFDQGLVNIDWFELIRDGGSGLRAKNDFSDGDGKSDLALYLPGSSSYWVTRLSSIGWNQENWYQWGSSSYGDIHLTGDYDGDGKSELVVFRPGSSAWWYIKLSSTGYSSHWSYQRGTSGDIPLTGDWDGDMRTDIAVYRPGSTGYFIVWTSSSGYSSSQSYAWGTSGDIPVTGDWDGDGRTDCTVLRQVGSAYRWFILRSTGGSVSYDWGSPSLGDIIVAGDFDGDRKTDCTVARPGSQMWWYVLESSSGFSRSSSYQWGTSGDIPVSCDFDGDRQTDICVYRPGSTSVWYVKTSSSGYNSSFSVSFGSSNYVPAGSARQQPFAH